MQQRLKRTLHRSAHRRSPSSSGTDSSDPRDSERLEHARERAHHPCLYPVYGIVYALARREAVVYPAVLRLFQFVILSTVFAAIAVIFGTPIIITLLKITSFGMLPRILLFIPAVIIALLLAAGCLAFCITAFKHSIDIMIAADVADHERIELERTVLETPRHWLEVLLWVIALFLSFVPVIGIVLFFFLHAQLRAHEIARTRARAESEWTGSERRRYIWRQMFRLQTCGYVMAFLEMIPLFGPIFHFSDLVAKALFVADAIKVEQADANSAIVRYNE